jgi:tetratricopeptide (TPR) repeat protein
MANDNQDNKPEVGGKQPIPAAKRRILQQWYEHGSKSSGKGDWDYANDMFTRCVTGDPGNRLYAQSFLGNLQKKYNNDKKGAKFAGMRGAGLKGTLKKASMQKNWPGVIETGAKLLELNPWDVPTLIEMAAACQSLEHDETEIVWLRGALEADIKDPEVNRLLGRALGKQAQFDQAIICWQRVQQGKPQDDEARRAIADLTVEKTIHKGGYEDAETSTDVMADKQAKAERQGEAGPRSTPEQLLEKHIAKNPTEISKYIELADLHRRNERYEEEENILLRALDASGGDANIRERVEDVQLRRQRQQLDTAHRRLQTEKTPEAEALVKQLEVELNNKELEVYRNRCDRYPGHAGWKYEFGVRLQRAGKYKEAITSFQQAQSDPRRKGAVLLAMGQCFQKIEQYKLAMGAYESAIQELGDRDLEHKKDALYLAGRMSAAKLKDYDKAEKYLTDLAGLDFGYKDVSELLDKIRRLRDKG